METTSDCRCSKCDKVITLSENYTYCKYSDLVLCMVCEKRFYK